MVLDCVLLGSTVFWLVGCFGVLLGKNCLRLVLFDLSFQPASKQVETVEKAFA